MDLPSQKGEWLCANCHTLCSLDRCTTCNGIKVKIRESEEIVSRSRFLLERVASPLPQQSVLVADARSKSPASQRLTNDAEDDELGMNLITPYAESEDREYGCVRPSDPIAGMLFTAPSPSPLSARRESVEVKSPSARKRLSNLSLDSPKLRKMPKPVT